jgi:hypothetical protein
LSASTATASASAAEAHSGIADDYDEAIRGTIVFFCMLLINIGLQNHLLSQRHLLPRHPAAGFPEKDGEVRMAAEEELKIRLGKKSLRPLGGARVDRFIE